MNELFENFIENDMDLLEATEIINVLNEEYIEEGLFKKKKKIDPNISLKQAINKSIQIMKDVIKDNKYNDSFRKAINIKYIKDDDGDHAVGHYEAWDYSDKVRSDDSVYKEFDNMLNTFIKEVNNELNKYGYFIDSDGDWDNGSIYLNYPAIVKEK